jgi:hypothetical protein
MGQPIAISFKPSMHGLAGKVDVPGAPLELMAISTCGFPFSLNLIEVSRASVLATGTSNKGERRNRLPRQ